MNIYSPTISGSLTISGSIITTGGGLPLTGSLISSGSFTSIGPTVISGSLSVITGSSIEFQVLDTGVKIGNLATDNHTITGSLLVSGSITTVGNITAQTLVVQTITSSVSFITGSTKFGSGSTDTHQFTGSLYITGSVGINAASSFRFNGVADTSHAVGYDSTVDGAFLRGQNGVRFLTGTGGGSERMRITSTETTLNFNPQSGSLLSGYNYLNFGGGSIMYRNMTDLYIGSNAKYGSAGTTVACYTSANGMGMLTMDGGTFNFQATTGSVTANTAYGMPIRMTITAAGNVGIGTSSPNSILEIQKDTNGDTPITFINGSGGSGNTNASISLNFTLRNGSGGSSGGVILKAGKETDHIGANVNDYFAISTTRSDAMAEKFRISSEGNILLTSGATIYNSTGSLYLRAGTSGDLILGAGGSNDRMRIENAYSVRFTSNNASAATFDLNYRFSSPDSARIRFATTTAFNQNEPGEISFWTRANDSQGGGSITERMRITSGGVSLFGGTTFTTITSAVLGATNPAFTGRNWSFGPNSSGDYVVYHNQGGGNTGVYLTYGGSSWTSNSDENIKDIIEIIPNALESIKDFRAVKFYWKNDESKKENIGLIAQDVQKSYPELIDKQIFDDKEILGVRYTELIPVLVKAIQELKTQNDDLQSQINELKAQ